MFFSSKRWLSNYRGHKELFHKISSVQVSIQQWANRQTRKQHHKPETNTTRPQCIYAWYSCNPPNLYRELGQRKAETEGGEKEDKIELEQVSPLTSK